MDKAITEPSAVHDKSKADLKSKGEKCACNKCALNEQQQNWDKSSKGRPKRRKAVIKEPEYMTPIWVSPLRPTQSMQVKVKCQLEDDSTQTEKTAFKKDDDMSNAEVWSQVGYMTKIDADDTLKSDQLDVAEAGKGDTSKSDQLDVAEADKGDMSKADQLDVADKLGKAVVDDQGKSMTKPKLMIRSTKPKTSYTTPMWTSSVPPSPHVKQQQLQHSFTQTGPLPDPVITSNVLEDTFTQTEWDSGEPDIKAEAGETVESKANEQDEATDAEQNEASEGVTAEAGDQGKAKAD